MSFYINAWLDHPKPFINVHHRGTNQLIAHFSGEELDKAMMDGDLSPDDFFKADKCFHQSMVKHLFLTRCRCDIGNECENIANHLAHRSN